MEAFFSEHSRLGRRLFLLGPDAISISSRHFSQRSEQIVDLWRIDRVDYDEFHCIHLILPPIIGGGVGGWLLWTLGKAEEDYTHFLGPLLMLVGVSLFYFCRGLPVVQYAHFRDADGRILFDIIRTRAQRDECDRFIRRVLDQAALAKAMYKPGATDNPDDGTSLNRVGSG